jgi:hypothetical protein
MLDRPKVMKELQESADKLFMNLSSEFNLAQEIWEIISNDPSFAHKAAQTKAPWLIPSWVGNLSDAHPITPHNASSYQVFSVDGSQIYPDRHQGTLCCLINIGSAVLCYGAHQRVLFSSKPFVHLPQESSDQDSSIDLINCRRQELEFDEGVSLAKKLKDALPSEQLLFLFDGSLIFWHLEGKEQTIKDAFIAQYISALHTLYELQVPIVGYISLPKSKELVNLIRLHLSNYDPYTLNDYKKIDHLVDTHIAGFFLDRFARTAIFASNSAIVEYYPPHLKPHFFYLNIGDEIARIELPAWLTKNMQTIDLIAQIIIDQTQKGHGYPVCLAEAHEQAVVKGPDRDFFYHMIQKIGYNCKQRLSISQKSLKKRNIGI